MIQLLLLLFDFIHRCRCTSEHWEKWFPSVTETDHNFERFSSTDVDPYWRILKASVTSSLYIFIYFEPFFKIRLNDSFVFEQIPQESWKILLWFSNDFKLRSHRFLTIFLRSNSVCQCRFCTSSGDVSLETCDLIENESQIENQQLNLRLFLNEVNNSKKTKFLKKKILVTRGTALGLVEFRYWISL